MEFTTQPRDATTVGIYRIRNLINGKVYVGSSKGIEYRCYEHRKDLRKNQHQNQYLQNAWNKHGEPNFVFEVVELCDMTVLLEREQWWINNTKCASRDLGYNLCEVADKPWMTQEVRDKISNTLKGNVPWNKGVPHTAEAKAKMRQKKLGIKGPAHSFYGKHHSEESKKKMSVSQKQWLETHDHSFLGRHHSEETKDKERMAQDACKLIRWQASLRGNKGKNTSSQSW